MVNNVEEEACLQADTGEESTCVATPLHLHEKKKKKRVHSPVACFLSCQHAASFTIQADKLAKRYAHTYLTFNLTFSVPRCSYVSSSLARLCHNEIFKNALAFHGRWIE